MEKYAKLGSLGTIGASMSVGPTYRGQKVGLNGAVIVAQGEPVGSQLVPCRSLQGGQIRQLLFHDRLVTREPGGSQRADRQ